MAKQYTWSSTPLSTAITIDDTNNVINIELNGNVNTFEIRKEDYKTSITQGTSLLADQINEIFVNGGIPARCTLGVFAEGITKYPYIVFEYEDTESFSYSGTIENAIGKVGLIKLGMGDSYNSLSFPIKIDSDDNTIIVSRDRSFWTYSKQEDGTTWDIQYENEKDGSFISLGSITEQDGVIIHKEENLSPSTSYGYLVTKNNLDGNLLKEFEVILSTQKGIELVTTSSQLNPEGNVSISGDGSIVAWGDNRYDDHKKGDMYIKNFLTGEETPVLVNEDTWDVYNLISTDGSRACYYDLKTNMLSFKDLGTNTVISRLEATLSEFVVSKNLKYILHYNDKPEPSGNVNDFVMRVYEVDDIDNPRIVKDFIEEGQHSRTPIGISDDGKRLIWTDNLIGSLVMYNVDTRVERIIFENDSEFRRAYSTNSTLDNLAYFESLWNRPVILNIDWSKVLENPIEKISLKAQDISARETYVSEDGSMIFYYIVDEKEGIAKIGMTDEYNREKNLIRENGLDSRFSISEDLSYLAYVSGNDSNNLRVYRKYIGHLTK